MVNLRSNRWRWDWRECAWSFSESAVFRRNDEAAAIADVTETVVRELVPVVRKLARERNNYEDASSP